MFSIGDAGVDSEKGLSELMWREMGSEQARNLESWVLKSSGCRNTDKSSLQLPIWAVMLPAGAEVL